MRPLKSYGRVGDIRRATSETPENEPPPRSLGDMGQEVEDAGIVLGNYVAVASYNIGKATLISLLQAEIDALKE